MELTPVPLGVLFTRLVRELSLRQAAFDLPFRHFFLGSPAKDLSVDIHGHRAASPLGPAAGPHTQLAQNIVLSFLAGCRVIELKTVQVKDDLVIPRPCIDMETVGFNVEWSQELSLKQSLEEYVKASMLIEMLSASGLLRGAVAAFGDTVFDMSVGYDLAGVRSERVREFMAGMLDAGPLVTRLRDEIPAEWKGLRDLPFRTRVSDTLTLSTFHGCPPDEIEGIVEFLLREVGLNVTVKLNPTLLGKDEVARLLRESLGYRELEVPDMAFEKDAPWDRVVGFVERLGAVAEEVGLSFGVKFTNTLIVGNHKSFFPKSEKQMYLSGPPLHVLAMALVRRFRKRFGDLYPVSFSGGIDAGNFADAVALGLGPVSVCTDFLRAGGYGRARHYFADLLRRMDEVGAADVDEFTLRAYGRGEAALEKLGLPPLRAADCRSALLAGKDLRFAAGDAFSSWVSLARLENTEVYVERVVQDPRYGAARNATPPRKVGSTLSLFDCLTCDKCIPVCPNDANFVLKMAKGPISLGRLVPSAAGFVLEAAGELAAGKPHQIANFADACNECGHCDVICPEYGGPYLAKPRFFGSVATFSKAGKARDGFALERTEDGVRMHGRIGGLTFVVEKDDGPLLRYRGEGFDLVLDAKDPLATVRGRAEGPVDLGVLRIMERLRLAVLASDAPNFISAALEGRS